MNVSSLSFHSLLQNSVLFLLGLGSLCSLAGEAWARDVRLALLIGHQRGWKKDPPLDYAIKGDVRPLASALKMIGFEVHTLENRGVDAVRRTFVALRRRLQQKPRVTTFLFYYSGHADRHHFHLGSNQKNPISYREFASFLSSLAVVRRIAILDACYSGELIREFGSMERIRRVLRGKKAKGVRARHAININNLQFPNQGSEKGLRIISSSIGLSWEIKHFGASVFTYFLLRGLQGAADHDRDGKIDVAELFKYTSRKVEKLTGQQPKQLIRVEEKGSYALAPNYRSHLDIAPHIVGQLGISVENFVWTTHKSAKKKLRVAVVHGLGTVDLRNQGRCWRQTLVFPKGGVAHLRGHWQKVPCRTLSGNRKGKLMLAMQTPDLQRQFKRTLPQTTFGIPHHSFSFSIGLSQMGPGDIDSPMGKDSLRALYLSPSISYRWKFVGLGLQYHNGAPDNKPFFFHRFLLRAEVGYPWDLSESWQIMAGGYANTGLIWQHQGESLHGPVLSAGAGAFAELSWWFAPPFGVRLSGQIGIDYAPLRYSSGLNLAWNTQISFLFGW